MLEEGEIAHSNNTNNNDVQMTPIPLIKDLNEQSLTPNLSSSNTPSSINKLKIEETIEAAKLITNRLISIHRVKKESEKFSTKRTFQDADLSRLTPLRDSKGPGELLDITKMDRTPPPSPLQKNSDSKTLLMNDFIDDYCSNGGDGGDGGDELPSNIVHIPIQESPSFDSFTTAKSDSFDRLPDVQIELLQSELECLQEKYSSTLKEKNDILLLLSEYEDSMSKMIYYKASSNNTDILSLKDLSLDDGIAFSNLKGKFEEARLIIDNQRQTEEGLREMISSLQSELSQADKRFSIFKGSAEDRIADANEELYRIKNSLETELSSAKAKLSRSELKIVGLEAMVASKTKENAELMAISDELIQRIDNNH